MKKKDFKPIRAIPIKKTRKKGFMYQACRTNREPYSFLYSFTVVILKALNLCNNLIITIWLAHKHYKITKVTL